MSIWHSFHPLSSSPTHYHYPLSLLKPFTRARTTGEKAHCLFLSFIIPLSCLFHIIVSPFFFLSPKRRTRREFTDVETYLRVTFSSIHHQPPNFLMYKPRASHTEAHLRESFSLEGASRPTLSRATIHYPPYNNYNTFNHYANILPSRESVASDQIISHSHTHTHAHPHTHTRMDATSSGKRLRDDSMSTDSPVPSKKYKQATSVGSSDSSSSNTSYGRLVDFDFQTMLRLDTPQPLFKDVKYDEPPARSVSPTPPSPKSS